jgi:hypothetical protein
LYEGVACVLAQSPVRLVTGEEPRGAVVREAGASWSVGAIAGWTTAALGLAIAAAVIAAHLWRRWPTRSGASLDRDAARSLAKRFGLSRRARATLWELARAEGDSSPLDLLVNVKKLGAAASRRAASTSGEAARESLAELCVALGAEVPSFPVAAGARRDARKLTDRARTAARVSVVAPRLIDRRG